MNDPDPSSPYISPSAPLENNEPAGGQSLTPRALTHLLASRKWMTLTAVAFCVLILLGISDYAITAAIIWEVAEISLAAPIIIAVVYLGFALCVIPPLLNCARLVKDSKSGADEHVALALQAHRQFWRRLGMGMLVVLGVTAALVLIFTAGINK